MVWHPKDDGACAANISLGCAALLGLSLRRREHTFQVRPSDEVFEKFVLQPRYFQGWRSPGRARRACGAIRRQRLTLQSTGHAPASRVMPVISNVS